MAISREDLQRRLSKLESDLPTMIAEHPDAGHFNQAFAERADEISEAASVDDDAWVFEQVDGILERAGLWQPGQDDLPLDE